MVKAFGARVSLRKGREDGHCDHDGPSKKVGEISYTVYTFRAAHRGGHPGLFRGPTASGGPIGAHMEDFFFLTRVTNFFARDDALKVQFTVF